MSSKTAIFSVPTTVIFRILCGRRDDAGGGVWTREHVVVRLGPASVRVARLILAALPVRRVAEPGQVGDVGEVAGEGPPPPPQAGLPPPQAHSFQTLSERLPFAPVAFRRSTTSTESSTSAS